MRRIAIISNVIFIFLFFACTPLKEIIDAPSPSARISRYMPVECDISYAQDIILRENLRDLIKQKFQEYVEDTKSWNAASKKVKLLIKITRIETPSIFKTALIGPTSPLVPPGRMSGEVIVYGANEVIGRYEVDAGYRTFWPFSSFVDLEDGIAGEFANQVMNKLR